jgi:hypothetical protein
LPPGELFIALKMLVAVRAGELEITHRMARTGALIGAVAGSKQFSCWMDNNSNR